MNSDTTIVARNDGYLQVESDETKDLEACDQRKSQLTRLVAIRAAFAGFAKSLNTAADYAVECGKLLHTAKNDKRVAHGYWIPFLRRTGISQTTALRWQKLWCHIRDKRLTKNEVHQLGITKALELGTSRLTKSIAPTTKSATVADLPAPTITVDAPQVEPVESKPIVIDRQEQESPSVQSDLEVIKELRGYLAVAESEIQTLLVHKKDLLEANTALKPVDVVQGKLRNMTHARNQWQAKCAEALLREKSLKKQITELRDTVSRFERAKAA